MSRVILSATATASPTSGDFLTLADARDLGSILLAEITLRARGGNPARTLRFSDRDFLDDSGNWWQPIIAAKTTLDAGGRFLDSAWQPVDFDLVLLDKRLPFQTITKTLGHTLSDYEWVGSAVTVYQAFVTLTDSTKWGIILEGEVASIDRAKPTEISISCIQERKWTRKFPPNTFNENDYPELPKDTAGVSVPILIGDWDTTRRLLDLSGTAQTNAAYAGIARGAFPVVSTDASESSTEAPKYLLSDDEMHTTNANGYLVDGSSGRLALSASVSVSNPIGGPAVMTLNDRTFFLCILGIDEHANTTTSSWNEASKESKAYDLTGYDLLDFDANQKILQVWLPEVSPLGDFVEASIRTWYSKNATGTAPTYGVKNLTTPAEQLFNYTNAATAGYPSDIPLAGNVSTISTASVIDNWAQIGQSTLHAEVKSAGDELRIHRWAVIIEFKARQSIVRPARQEITREPRYPGVNPRSPLNILTRDTASNIPASYAFNPSLVAFGKGLKDGDHDVGGDGDYTGTADALIEHPADVVHWLAIERGGLAAANVTTAASTFGSFTDIRTTLANYKMLAHVSRYQNNDQFIQEVGAQFLVWFYRRNHAANQPWVAVPWDTGTAVNYRSAAAPFKFAPKHMEGKQITADYTPISQVRNVVRVNFDQDLRTNSYGEQVFIDQADSRGWTGSAYARDQNGGAPDNRETLATESVTAYGEKEAVLNLSMVRDPATATDIRNRYFDLVYRPRVVVKFTTYLNAVDLERGMVITFDQEWDDSFPCPVLDSGGSWLGVGFRVVRVTRREAAQTLYNVEAVEV